MSSCVLSQWAKPLQVDLERQMSYGIFLACMQAAASNSFLHSIPRAGRLLSIETKSRELMQVLDLQSQYLRLFQGISCW